ncbi:succinate dehydrogenase/fumarate reductase flavoprotein subunit, partial [Nguyenibacter vanlangensis]|nr:succinate dehydrogenase/fumarate reductase flavoprotein subunit [Nguyenibacter vanlangensis]
ELIRPAESIAPLPPKAGEAALDRLDRLRFAKGGTRVAAMRDTLQRTMQKHAAVFRNTRSLAEGVGKIANIWTGLPDLSVADRSLIWNSDLMEALEFENLLANATVTMAGADARHESRGAQAHDDYPERDDENWMKHTVAHLDDQGGVDLSYRPVHMKTLTDAVQVFPPKKRVY